MEPIERHAEITVSSGLPTLQVSAEVVPLPKPPKPPWDKRALEFANKAIGFLAKAGSVYAAGILIGTALKGLGIMRERTGMPV